MVPSQPFLLLAFTALTVAWSAAAVAAPDLAPISAVTVVFMVGGFFLQVRSLGLLYLVVAACVAYVIVRREENLPIGVLGVLIATAVLVMQFARSRERLGVQGILGESMLVDLRDRLHAQGRIPALPPEWRVETVLRSAYGDSFSGDFLVATRSTDGHLLEMVLVDVSGKGQAAGTRALLLSGAFGGLLGASTQTGFLVAANNYLLRQRWDEGFATAVHLGVDLRTGQYRLASAGHPPAAHFHAGSGRWEVISTEHGPALGIVESVDFPAHLGRLQRGDALLLYTDGLVETPGRDVTLGIDRLMGEAERAAQHGGFRGAAARIVDATGAAESDDRALVLLWRQ